ncbi:FAD-dependent oxidoreductase [Phaeobacter sp. NW0010-22]|uniref:NAD(P)/FAD-dependent oxidoreductase n=1 Tax=Phaeobacter sp. NW0010-22 TaxID=3135907 RepID=UPI00310B65C9
MTKVFEYAVIGAGIAGASVAAELAGDASVVLVEMESQPGYHTTGRSAAMFAPGYGPQPVRALTRASADFFCSPPEGFSEVDLLSPRDVIMVARSDQTDALDDLIAELASEAAVERIDAQDLRDRHPLFRAGYAEAGMLDRGGSEIDVNALHQGYLNQFRQRNGQLHTKFESSDLTFDGKVWHLTAGTEVIRAAKVINAAGAWADEVGQKAGAERIGLVPMRRTALTVEAPEGVDIDALPLVVDIDEEFYMKPEAGRLLISPANEDPMAPCDAQPEELDIAFCIDRIERAFDIQVQRIKTKWAGLRSFVPDKSPVVGFSVKAPHFFWLAGQGGYGIQTAPALARCAAALISGHPVPQDILKEDLDLSSLSPKRLVTSAK